SLLHSRSTPRLTIFPYTTLFRSQIEFDDRPLAEPYAVSVLWNPVEDDFLPKPPEVFQKGVEFALEAVRDSGAKVFIHCAAGVHRDRKSTRLNSSHVAISYAVFCL